MPSNNIDSMLGQVVVPPVQPQEVKFPVENSALAPVEDMDDLELENPHVEEQKPDILQNKVENQQKAAQTEPKLEEKAELADDFDEYGNEKPKKEAKSPKMYSEEEMNERINQAVRERLARLERNSQSTAQNQPQAQPQNANNASVGANDADWEKQFEDLTFKALEKREALRAQQEAQEREARATQEFESKFHSGMANFKDFREVVGMQPITDAMTMATRALKDPAGFLYAASKKHSDELKRISSIPDPYAQMVEMGRLEERMRKMKVGPTNAPKPIRPVREDAIVSEPDYKEPTIEERMMQMDQQRMARMRTRR